MNEEIIKKGLIDGYLSEIREKDFESYKVLLRWLDDNSDESLASIQERYSRISALRKFRLMQESKGKLINDETDNLTKIKKTAEIFIIGFYYEITKNQDIKKELITQVKNDKKLREYIRKNNPASDNVGQNITLPMMKLILYSESNEENKNNILKMKDDETGKRIINTVKKLKFYEIIIDGKKREPFIRETDQSYRDLRDEFIISAFKIYVDLQTKNAEEMKMEKLNEMAKSKTEDKENKVETLRPKEKEDIEIMGKRAVIILGMLDEEKVDTDKKEIIECINNGEEDRILEFVDERLSNKNLTYNQRHILKEAVKAIILFEEYTMPEKEKIKKNEQFIQMKQRKKAELVKKLFNDYSYKLKMKKIEEKISFKRSTDKELMELMVEIISDILALRAKVYVKEAKDGNDQRMEKLKMTLCDNNLLPEEAESSISTIESIISLSELYSRLS